MRYLFFDIECANSKDGRYYICEFGYVITNNAFEILDKGEMLINPDTTFDWYVVKNLLTRAKEVYYQSPKFDKYYERIRNLLTQDNLMIFGYAVDSDALYLNYESFRYMLEYINYDFYDVEIMYKNINHSVQSCKLKDLYEVLGCGKANKKHSALDDAISTCKCLEAISKKYKMSIDELICTTKCRGTTNNGIINGRKEKFNKIRLDNNEHISAATIGEQLKVKGINISKLID